MEERLVVCCSCGEKAELPAEEAPCEVLHGWLTVSHFKGAGSVEHYNFCSFACLKKWAEAQAPEIPEVFLESFTEDSVEGDGCP